MEQSKFLNVLRGKDPRPEEHDACVRIHQLIQKGVAPESLECQRIRDAFPNIFSSLTYHQIPLTDVQEKVLHIIRECEGIKYKELFESLDISDSGLKYTLAYLRKRNKVERYIASGEKRVRYRIPNKCIT